MKAIEIKQDSPRFTAFDFSPNSTILARLKRTRSNDKSPGDKNRMADGISDGFNEGLDLWNTDLQGYLVAAPAADVFEMLN